MSGELERVIKLTLIVAACIGGLMSSNYWVYTGAQVILAWHIMTLISLILKYEKL
jgi:hypothetical protein